MPTLKTLTAQAKQDLRYLEAHSPPAEQPVAPSAWLSVAQLWEVERMASQGMSLAQIGVRLRFSDDVWADYIAHNPQVQEAYTSGAVRGVDEISATLYSTAKGGEVSAMRYYLDRLGGPQFAPPKPSAPTVIVQNGTAVTIDQRSVPDAFDKQQALLESEAVDLEADEPGAVQSGAV